MGKHKKLVLGVVLGYVAAIVVPPGKILGKVSGKSSS
jgi:hypothetical protein